MHLPTAVSDFPCHRKLMEEGCACAGVIVLLVVGLALLVLIVGQNALDIAHKAASGSQNTGNSLGSAVEGFMPAFAALTGRH